MRFDGKWGKFFGIAVALGSFGAYPIQAQQAGQDGQAVQVNEDTHAANDQARADNKALRAKGEYVQPSNIDWPEPWRTMLQSEGYYSSRTWSSKAVADEVKARTQIDYDIPTASPKWRARSFLPVNGKGGMDATGPYTALAWPKPLYGNTTSDWGFGGQGSIYVESPDRVFVLQRDELPPITRPLLKAGYIWGPDPIMEYVKAPIMTGRRKGKHVMIFDRAGNLVDWWKQWNHLWDGDNEPGWIAVSPYDPEKHIWIIADERMHKFTNDGKKLVMTIENRDPSGKWIGMHGGIAWLPNGDFYVTGIDRIVRFNKDGKFLYSVGSHGSGPGQFGGLLQGMAIDPVTHRIYVGDRLNSRVSVFDENGKFIEDWPNIMGTYVIRISKDRHVWIIDSATNKFLKYDMDGKFITSFGTFGIGAGAIWSAHGFETDDEGAVYMVTDYSGREGAIQKWLPRKDVDPKDPRFIGPLYR